jgi:hypothetical protein
MREREEEIKNIHRGMHQVNEIYKVGADVDLIFHVCVCVLLIICSSIIFATHTGSITGFGTLGRWTARGN